MALKFRRGTTAQKSGSLAFGEPYVNTTEGALQVGLESGDITIRSVDSTTALVVTSVSASSFVSASSLNVSGNATIGGNLTLGGNITIGDATTDTVTVTANLSSSLIPSVTNVFDLGSADKIWRDLYLSTGSIKLVNGSGTVVNTITNANIVTTDSIASGSVSLTNSLPDGTVSGSSQITLQSTTGFSAFDTALKTITGSLISSASTAKTTNDSQDVSITNLNTFSGSQLTQNTALATITGSLISSASSFETRNASLATITGSLISTASTNTQRLTAMEAVSGSWITEAETSSFARTNTSNIFTTNQIISGGLDVTGTITANEFHTTYVSSSVMYNSGSNRFGDSADDLQQLIGIVEITGSIKGTQFNNLATITGSLISSASSFESRNASLATITGSLISTSSNHEQRIAANEAISSSYVRTNSENSINGTLHITGAIEIFSSSGAELRLIDSDTNIAYHIQNKNHNFSIHNNLLGTTVFRIDSGSAEQTHAHIYGGLFVSGVIDSQRYITAPQIMAGGITGSFSGSINGIGNVTSFSSSVDTRITNVSSSLDTLSGSTYSVSASLDTRISNVSSSLDTLSGSTYSVSSSLNTRITNVSSSLDILSGSTYSVSSSVDTRISNVSSSLYTTSASFESRNVNLATISGSLISTASNHEQRLDAMEAESGSYARINSTNTFVGNQTITGSLYVSADLIVQGSSSIQNISSSTLNIGTNLITVAVNNPSVRFGGLSVIDSGSIGASGSFLYDSVDDEFIFVHKGNGMNITSSHFILGPETYDNLGNETYLTANRLPKGAGNEHLVDSTISDNGTQVSITAADGLYVMNSLTASAIRGTINATNGVVSGSSQIDVASTTGDIVLGTRTSGNYVASLVAGTNITLSNNSGEGATPSIGLTNNAITIAETSTSLGGSITAAKILEGTGVVSGSSQIDLTATTNYASGILTRLNAVGVFSGSAQVSGISNAQLSNSTISGKALGTNLDTLTIGTGLSGTSYNGSSAVTIANTGVISNIAGTGISVSAATGNVTITNTGVTSISAGTGVGVSAGTGAVTVSIGQAVATSSSPTFAGLTINGAITATGDITAYYTSDRRHKNNIQTIPNALQKVSKLNGVTWEWNDDVHEVTKSTPKTGLIAQEVQLVLPEVVTERADGFLALDYSKMMGLMVEAIKEQQIKIDNLTAKVEELKRQRGL